VANVVDFPNKALTSIMAGRAQSLRRIVASSSHRADGAWGRATWLVGWERGGCRVASGGEGWVCSLRWVAAGQEGSGWPPPRPAPYMIKWHPDNQMGFPHWAFPKNQMGLTLTGRLGEGRVVRQPAVVRAGCAVYGGWWRGRRGQEGSG